MSFEQTSTRTVYENEYIVLRQDNFAHPAGHEGVYTFIEKPDSSLVIPFENGGFHMIEQYRYPIGRRSLEFPNGTYPNRRDGEAEALAREELAEETGFRAGKLQHLGFVYGAPGMSSQGLNIFLATELTPGDTSLEESEQDLTQRWVSIEEFDELVRGGVIADGPTIIARAFFGGAV